MSALPSLPVTLLGRGFSLSLSLGPWFPWSPGPWLPRPLAPWVLSLSPSLALGPWPPLGPWLPRSPGPWCLGPWPLGFPGASLLPPPSLSAVPGGVCRFWGACLRWLGFCVCWLGGLRVWWGLVCWCLVLACSWALLPWGAGAGVLSPPPPAHSPGLPRALLVSLLVSVFREC